MKDRIRLIMESEQLTPSAFADRLQLGRAVVSHILNGRNNPSLDVVTRILSKMEYINPDWLISGKGDMYKPEYGKKNANTFQATPITQNHPDLFSQNYVSPPIAQKEPEYRKEIIVEQPQNEVEQIIKKEVIYQKLPDRKVSKIIIYYTDNTFETFNADNKPL
ncbi:helix-turn-helix domain-containing protein [Dysgonomonas reticulitermitis]|nr:transcriptional regulator [Bacteroidia bacterium]